MTESPTYGTTFRDHAVSNAVQLSGVSLGLSGVRAGGIDPSLQALAELRYNQYAIEEKPMADITTRIVTVYLVDPNPNLPVERRVLYKSDEGFATELTDQELFFEIDVAGLLKKHNEFRVTVEDKKASTAKEKTVMLEPVRIRDLKMQVIVLAQF